MYAGMYVYVVVVVVGLFFPAVGQIKVELCMWVPRSPVLEEGPQPNQRAPQ